MGIIFGYRIIGSFVGGSFVGGSVAGGSIVGKSDVGGSIVLIYRKGVRSGIAERLKSIIPINSLLYTRSFQPLSDLCLTLG